MMNFLWCGMVCASILYAFLNGSWVGLWERMLGGASSAISFTVVLAAGYAFFCGFLRVADELGMQRALARILRPLLKRIFTFVRSDASFQAVATNLSANMLGLGNAATPAGIEAMRAMQAESLRDPAVREDIRLFLVVNATSVQLLPTTLLAMRAAAGSASPSAIIAPTLACSLLSTLLGVLLCKLCAWRLRRRAR